MDDTLGVRIILQVHIEGLISIFDNCFKFVRPKNIFFKTLVFNGIALFIGCVFKFNPLNTHIEVLWQIVLPHCMAFYLGHHCMLR